MNRAFFAVVMPAVVLTGCGSQETPVASEGAKPITVVTPTQASATPTLSAPAPSPSAPPSVETSSATPRPGAVDEVPRETDFNTVDVMYLAESVVRSRRIVSTSEILLAADNISPEAKDIATRVSQKHSARLATQEQLLTTWGITTSPEVLFPPAPIGIPTQADVDQLHSMHGKDLENRYLNLLQGNIAGAVTSAQQHLGKGFNPELQAAAQLVVDEAEKEQAPIMEALKS